MAPPIMPDPVTSACDSVKKHCQVLWLMYLESIERGVPQLFLPKALADEMSPNSIAQIATRLGNLMKSMVAVYYDPLADAYRIGALEHLPRAQGHVLIMELPYVEPSQPEQTLLGHSSSEFTDASIQEPIVAQPKSVGRISSTPEKNEKIPKPPNCFILYRKDKHPIIQAQYPEARNIEISVIIGKMWRNETPEVKAKYKERADDEKRKLLIEHPDWKCSPRKSSEIKKRAPSADIPAQTPATETSQADQIPAATPLCFTYVAADGSVWNLVGVPYLGQAPINSELIRGPITPIPGQVPSLPSLYPSGASRVPCYQFRGSLSSESAVSHLPFEDEGPLTDDIIHNPVYKMPYTFSSAAASQLN